METVSDRPVRAGPASRGGRKVLLVFPPTTSVAHFEPMVTPPLGIAYLGAALRARGYEVSAIDAMVEDAYGVEPLGPGIVRYGLRIEEIVRRIEAARPDVLGLSCLFSSQWPVVREIAARARRSSPDLVIAAGGTHPSFLWERCLRESDIDFVVIGEGDRTFPDALDRLRDGRSLEGMPGVAWRDGDTARRGPPVALIEDLDVLPFPAYDLFPLERYFDLALPHGYTLRSRRSVPVVTSRGCPCRCSFCSSSPYWGSRHRARSAEHVLAEIEWLRSTFGIEEIHFHDDNLTADRERALRIFTGLKSFSPRLSWKTPSGLALWTLDEGMLRLMRESGCFEISLAVESGDQGVLRDIARKPLRLEKVVEVNRAARACGIFRIGYFIIGFPGESRAQIENTVRFSRRLRLDWSTFFIFSPMIGSPLFEDCVARGLVDEETVCRDDNLFFSTTIDSPEWTAGELESIIRREYLRSCASVLSNPRVVLPAHIALLRARPNLPRFLVSRTKRAIDLALRRLVSGPPRSGSAGG
jgi:anaerobic magnesium-protoporphyrin IX monomethyl ester cyclase